MIDAQLAAVENRFVIKTNPVSGAVTLIWWIEGPHHLSLDGSIIVGEIAYHLRSALDNLICALVRIDLPESSCAGRSFPIFVDADEFDAKAAESLKGVPGEARTIIRSLQPFARGAGVRSDPLHILNVLSNRDKHRAMRLAAGYSARALFLISHHTGKPLLSFRMPNAHFTAGPHIIELPLTVETVTPYANVKAMGKNQVAFLDPGPWGDRPVDEVLTACVDYVDERVLPQFRQFFSSTAAIQEDLNFSPD